MKKVKSSSEANIERNGSEDILNGLKSISSNPKVHFEFLSIFLRQFKVDVVELAKSIEQVDHNKIFDTAHKMKSSIKYFDADMYGQISNLEKYGHEKTDLNKIKSEYAQFNSSAKFKLPLLEAAAIKLKYQLDGKVSA